jgi:hypothetical protein
MLGICLGLALASCESLFEPVTENIYDDGRIVRDAAFAEGIVLQAYTGLPTTYGFEETATDDAVSNQVGNNLSRMATGEWSSQFNPLKNWETAYQQLYYLNFLLHVADEVEWSWESEVRNTLFKNRFTGEAHGLRAWYNFELLKRHGGVSESGEALGFVIITPEQVANPGDESLLHLPRSPYNECVKFILDDIAEASRLLPDEYANTGDSEYDQVFGVQNKNRFSGKAAKALKARVLLHAASQSFYTVAGKWEAAADAAADLIKSRGGVAGLSPTGGQWYLNFNDPDIIWRRDYVSNNSLEAANFPPSLYGNGSTNPSQNLVDAFPMANGYPITNPQSGYQAGDPYRNRDPRLKASILYDGNEIGGKIVQTDTGDPKNGINATPTSTRTGYYLKKLLRGDVNLTPGKVTTQPHFYTFFRHTEMFLIYAEAANEAWGPEADPKGHGFTPAGVIAAIRERGGITQPDLFLASVAVSKESMRGLIRNERRIELCFEGFRFWDIRRWNLPMNETAAGMSITGAEFSIVDVEDRVYQPHMKFGPIPYDEILKAPQILQNAGW